MASTSDADHIETQNDQHLDALHAKIRTLRGVTTDIYQDVERQHLTLDETFGLSGGVKQWRNITYCVVFIVGFWIAYKILGWWMGP
ncbi:hypothetical protein DFH11DRAFT_1687602 [Phellopilus nigrolimitatus]|nr:hypothetical protein DFH11DRAFT_1687602 [Phellopilus nigrolimitatus]